MIGSAVFKQKHTRAAVFGQPIGEDAARRTGADDDVIESLTIHSRGRPLTPIVSVPNMPRRLAMRHNFLSWNPNAKIASDDWFRMSGGRDATLLRRPLAAIEISRNERHSHKMRNIARLHLLNNGGPMMFCRPRADAQLVRNELGRQPLQQKGEDLPLALGEQGLPSLEFPHFERSVAGLVAARQRFLDSQQQRLGVE